MAKQSITRNNSDSTGWEPSKASISGVEKEITKAKYTKDERKLYINDLRGRRIFVGEISRKLEHF